VAKAGRVGAVVWPQARHAKAAQGAGLGDKAVCGAKV